MSNALKLAAAVGGAEAPPYVDDVFSTHLYTGNSGTQTINNGIDLAGKGGMVWSKTRSDAYSHSLWDSVSGTGGYLKSDATSAKTTLAGTTFNNNGFTFSGIDSVNNSNSILYSSWTFRKAPKFFDVVTWTGNDVAGRQIAHSLGTTPGMVIVKCTSAGGAWPAQHRSVAMPAYGYLNLTGAFAAQGTNAFNGTAATSTVFTVGSDIEVNGTGQSYVAYLFAHDPSADGIIQCGSFTTDGSGNATVNLGWEPQYFLVKAAGIAQNWFVVDAARGMSHISHSTLYPNLSDAEALANNGYVPTATGLQINGALSAVQSYIYLAIRRPNKPPTSGIQVYNAIARTGTGAAATVTGVGFAPDISIIQQHTIVRGSVWYDRLRGATAYLTSTTAGAEGTNAQGVTSFNMDGVSLGAEVSVNGVLPIINWFFKRAPGVFDIVCYTGTGATTNLRVAHNLAAIPELVIKKARDSVNDWWVYFGNINTYLRLNGTQALATQANAWGTASPTTTDFGVDETFFATYQTNVLYFFATKAGISKVGSYMGNGSSQTINCGFTTGARFILIKRTDAAGDWFVWDTARGIVAANDPHLSLNTTAAEVTTDDSVDANTSGFIVNQVAATNINVNAATYIFLAIS